MNRRPSENNLTYSIKEVLRISFEAVRPNLQHQPNAAHKLQSSNVRLAANSISGERENCIEERNAKLNAVSETLFFHSTCSITASRTNLPNHK